MALRSRFAKSRRLCLEPLEARANPSNFTVTYSGPTMTIVGDADENDIWVDAVVGDSTKFALYSANDTFNGGSTSLTTPADIRIQNIIIKTLGGADRVTFSNTVAPINLAGNLSFDGGDDANSFLATDLTVGKALNMTNGANAAGSDSVRLFNLSVGGAVTIRNGDGDTLTAIQRLSAGTSRIGNSVTVSNGTGADDVTLIDTHVGGNVTINNGKARADGEAGHTHITNEYNLTNRSVIKGNVSVTYLDGNQTPNYADGIFDTEVTGNVTFSHGTGNFVTKLDGYRTTLPVLIGGNLTLKGTGVNTVNVGTSYQQTGMVVGGNFTSTSGGGNHALKKLEVKGSASIASTSGAPVITGTNVVVGRNLSIARNTNANTTLTNLNVGGALNIKSSTGGATTIVDRNATGWNLIGGNVNIASRAGVDRSYIRDTNVGGNLTVNSGTGDGAAAGEFRFNNELNTVGRATIGGNVVVSFLDGDGISTFPLYAISGASIYDAEVNGNVTINNGSGVFETIFNDYRSGLPVLVHGEVSITGTGRNYVSIGSFGSANNMTNKGLIVDKSFKLITGTFDDVVNLRDLHVGGVATMNLGDGANTVSIDDSTFCSKLTILTGSGVDQINLDTLTGTTRATEFKAPVLIRTGTGIDELTRAGNADGNQAIVVWSTFVFDSGPEGDVFNGEPSHVFFPFGGSIQVI